MRRFLLSALFLFSCALTWAQVQARLVSPATSIQPGQPLTVALELTHQKPWHTYWLFPGTGYPTSLSWKLPEGWSASEIRWPVPGLIHDRLGGISGYGYDGTVLLPVVLTPPAQLNATSLTLSAKAEWLMCDEQCIPGQAEVSLTLPVTPSAQPADATLAQALAAQPWPGEAAPWQASAQLSPTQLILSFTPLAGTSDFHFFTADGAVAYDQAQPSRTEEGRVSLTLPRAAEFEGTPQRLEGVLAFRTAEGSRAGVQLSLPFGAAASPASSGLGGTLALAFLGGLILNLMPCVFPVLGIKILGFVQQAGAERGKVAAHGFAFSGGVLLSFWALAGALALLRAGGAELGWGFQLQSPEFVFVLTLVMLGFGLNMSGLFEFGLSATGLGAELQTKSGLSGSFFSGILATVVATPCSAPFLAPALGTALALPLLPSFAIFTTIAVGLALPYLLLSLFPSAVRLLPRPGAWMETFKHVMAFPLYATAAYLLWVLAGQVEEKALRNLLLSLVLVAFGLWLYGRSQASYGKPGRTRALLLSGLLCSAGGIAFGWPKAETTWQPWSTAAVAEARAQGRWVYVDFTARWCATCQTNKAVVFSSSEVQRRLAELDVVLLKADWTKRDALITQELARWGRSAVPVNLVYAPGAEGKILPEILTPQLVLDALTLPPKP